MVVYEKVIRSHVDSELPFMATENILMEAVKRGGDRQELHEKIRVLSMEAGKQVKEEGLNNDLIQRILNDNSFNMSEEEILFIIAPEKFTGRAAGQVEDFIRESVNPILDKNKDLLGINVSINV
jgi:adenylosuccinate lyase